jgi:hypothetical protein
MGFTAAEPRQIQVEGTGPVKGRRRPAAVGVLPIDVLELLDAAHPVMAVLLARRIAFQLPPARLGLVEEGFGPAGGGRPNGRHQRQRQEDGQRCPRPEAADARATAGMTRR